MVRKAGKYIFRYSHYARMNVNSMCDGYEPWQIILLTFSLMSIIQLLLNKLTSPRETFFQHMKRQLFTFMKGLPIISGIVAKELKKNQSDMIKAVFHKSKDETYHFSLPDEPMDEVKLFEELSVLAKMGNVDWKNGRISGTVYNNNEEHTNFVAEVNKMFLWSNPLHVDVFPGVRKMEAEVISMCCRMYSGDENCTGSMTSGGTESILMAMKAYRDRGYARGIKRPEIICCDSAHAAFDKAGHYFEMTVTKVPCDPITKKVDLRAMRRAVSSQTVVLVGSAFSFPYGIIDDIEGVAAIARRYDLGVHVDCCLGGFIMPFMEEAGNKVAPFDFSVDGVSTISCDTHKYGYAPKGSSVILYKSKTLHEYQFFCAPDWPGGIYACPAVAGSRPGSLIAATWAIMMHLGRKGYVDATRKILASARVIRKCVEEEVGLKVMGQSVASVVAFASDDFDVYRVQGEMDKRGWNLNVLQFPKSVHICCTLVHTETGVTEAFCKDLREASAMVRSSPREKTEGMGAIYGMSQAIPDRSIVNSLAAGFLSACVRVDPLDNIVDGTDNSNEKKRK